MGNRSLVFAPSVSSSSERGPTIRRTAGPPLLAVHLVESVDLGSTGEAAVSDSFCGLPVLSLPGAFEAVL